MEISSEFSTPGTAPLYTREGRLTYCPCCWAARSFSGCPRVSARGVKMLGEFCRSRLEGNAARTLDCGSPRTIHVLLPWLIHSANSEQPGFLPCKVEPAFNFGCWWGSGEWLGEHLCPGQLGCGCWLLPGSQLQKCSALQGWEGCH